MKGGCNGLRERLVCRAVQQGIVCTVLSPELSDLGITLVSVDRDTEAFNEILAARRMSKKTDDEKAARLAALEKANQEATQVPLSVVERSVEAMELALGVAREGLPASVSDAGVAGACALAAAEGAALNVRINLPSITDADAARRIADGMDALLRRARELGEQVRTAVDEALREAT